MKIIKTSLSGVYIIEPKIFKDERGMFVKVFHEQAFKEIGLLSNFKETFYSISKKNVIRGMHFQIPPFDHVKLVYVVEGKILDVILDIRRDSSTYGRYTSMELSSQNRKAVYIPTGFAHGFIVKSNSAIVVYMQTTVHSPEYDRGIRWDSFGMDWGIKNPITSERDRKFPLLDEFESPFIYKG